MAAAMPGNGPRDGGFALHADTAWLLLAGDETALPALEAILTTLPQALPTVVLLEADDPAEHAHLHAGGRSLHLVARTPGATLAHALEALPIMHGPGQAWVAGAADCVAAVRTLLQEQWGLDRGAISS